MARGGGGGETGEKQKDGGGGGRRKMHGNQSTFLQAVIRPCVSVSCPVCHAWLGKWWRWRLLVVMLLCFPRDPGAISLRHAKHEQQTRVAAGSRRQPMGCGDGGLVLSCRPGLSAGRPESGCPVVPAIQRADQRVGVMLPRPFSGQTREWVSSCPSHSAGRPESGCPVAQAIQHAD